MTARSTAWQVLRDVRQHDGYANLVLPRVLASSSLSPADRGFATELVYGTLRLQGRYDAIIALASGRPVQEIDAGSLDILRLGCHQALALETPAHACVNESVRLAKAVGHTRSAGFINAVMRRISGVSLIDWHARVVDSAHDARGGVAQWESHPEWVVDILETALRADDRAGEIGELLAANNATPDVSLIDLRRIDSPSIAPLANEEGDDRTPLSAGFAGGDPSPLLKASGGLVRVQDVGSQVAALLLGRARPVSQGERWLDMCAGPGGKSADLAALGAANDVTLVSNEPTPHRLELVRQATKPFVNVEFLEQDGRSLAVPEGSFDRVMLDAPCSGLGAIRRRPESRWRKRFEDIPPLVELQAELLEAACRYVKPGGLVAYVTCTPTLAETRLLIERVMSGRSDFRAVPVAPILENVAPGLAPVTATDAVQLWPHTHNTDGMFLSLFERSE